ncbi:MAG: hypothetical protein Q4B85_09065 [Lachnospiraceae bacterium]|nr:hypothetical protein [Lachnospiraceae bacterium]
MKKMIQNYKSLIEEISNEVKEGFLTEKDQIQVLRDEKPLMQDYCPILDWYYDAFVMQQEMETPLEEMYLEEEFTKEEWQEMHQDLEQYKKQYEAEKEKLITISVKDALTEMKQMQKLFK